MTSKSIDFLVILIFLWILFVFNPSLVKTHWTSIDVAGQAGASRGSVAGLPSRPLNKNLPWARLELRSPFSGFWRSLRGQAWSRFDFLLCSALWSAPLRPGRRILPRRSGTARARRQPSQWRLMLRGCYYAPWKPLGNVKRFDYWYYLDTGASSHKFTFHYV